MIVAEPLLPTKVTKEQKEYLKKFIEFDAPLNRDDFLNNFETDNGNKLAEIFDLKNKSLEDLDSLSWDVDNNIEDILFVIHDNFELFKKALVNRIEKEKNIRKGI